MRLRKENMRNAVVRKKRLKAQRIVDDFMRMPQRLVVGVPSFRDINLEAVSAGRVWEMPERDGR